MNVASRRSASSIAPRMASLWPAPAVAASALAASLVLFVGYREVVHPPDKTLVAVLQKDAQSPAFLVSVDLRSE